MVAIDRQKALGLASEIERRITSTGLRARREEPKPDRYGEVPTEQEGYYDGFHRIPRARRTLYGDRQVWDLEVDLGQQSRFEIDGWSPTEETIKLSIPNEGAKEWRTAYLEFARFRRPVRFSSTTDRVAVANYSGAIVEKDMDRLLATLEEKYPAK